MKSTPQSISKNERTVNEDQGIHAGLNAEEILEAGIVIGQARLHTREHVREGLAQIERWMEIKRRKPWKLVKQSWEEWAQPNLYYSDTYIDEMIKSAHKIGPEAVQAMLDAEVSLRKIIAVRRAATEGKIRIEGAVIHIGREAIDITKNREDAEALYNTLYEERRIEREGREKAEAADAANRDFAQQQILRQHELLNQKDAEIERLKARPAPKEFATEADKRRWQTLCAVRNAIEVAVGQLRAVFLDEDTTLPTWREAETLIGLGQHLLWHAGKELLELHGDVLGQFAALEPPMPFPMGDWPERDARGLSIATAPALALHSGNGHETIDHPDA